MLLLQLGKGLLDEALFFLNFHCMRGMIVFPRIRRFMTGLFLHRFDRGDRSFLFSLFGDGPVHGNAEQPGIKRGVSLKRG